MFKIAAPFTTRPHLPVPVERVGLTDRSVLNWTQQQNNRRKTQELLKSVTYTFRFLHLFFGKTLSHHFSVL